MSPFNTDQPVTFSNYLISTQPELQIKQIIDGLSATPRSISSKFLYDATGSMLFNEITLLPDYYLTNLEMSLIGSFAKTNITSIENKEIVDLGCGNEKKVCLLLNTLDVFNSVEYTPLDVSISALNETANNLLKKYPGIHIHCIAADFLNQLYVLPESNRKRIFCFFGSTIGNLSFQQRFQFFKTIRKMIKPGDLLLLGVDLVKQIHVMEKAYNDALNLTARFNRNILNVINSQIQADFNPSAFEHVAFYNEINSRIEMHLKATYSMPVNSPYLPTQIILNENEMIHTENSRKFTVPQIISEIESVGLHVKAAETDDKKQYALLQINSS
jgi:L-histidine N-alpha-methyltransferase